MRSLTEPIRTVPRLEWFAVHTWSRHENSVFEQLRCKSIESFLPVYNPCKRWRNGQMSRPVPLFPGYLFVRIDINNPLPVLQTSGVAKFVSVGCKPAVLADNEITQLSLAVVKGIGVCPHLYMTIGDRVRIKTGPLVGLTGILAREKCGFRVVLSVELIGRSISVELNSCDVERVEVQRNGESHTDLLRTRSTELVVHPAGKYNENG